MATFLAANLKIDGRRAVLWVDDAHEHFEYGLTLDRIHDLRARYRGLIIAITVHTASLEPPQRGAGGQLSAVDAALIRTLDELAEGHELGLELNETERATARDQYPGLEDDIEDEADFRRLPAWFAGVSYLQRRYRNGRHHNLGGVAIAKAAIDWRRAGMPVGITPAQLRQLAYIELDDLGHGQTFTDTSYETALGWAKGEDNPHAASRWRGIALLRPVPGSHGSLWRDFDAITAWAPSVDPPLTPAAWEHVLRHLTPDTPNPVGIAAYQADELDVAERAFRIGAASAHTDEAPRAMFNLGVLLREGGRVEEAEAAYRDAIATRHTDAAPRATSALKRLRKPAGDNEDSSASGPPG